MLIFTFTLTKGILFYANLGLEINYALLSSGNGAENAFTAIELSSMELECECFQSQGALGSNSELCPIPRSLLGVRHVGKL